MILCSGCQTVPKVGGRQALPPVPPGTTQLSDDKPDHPYEPWGEGVAGRSMFTSPSDEGYTVEVRDYLVSPLNPEALVRLDGAAVLEVRQGAGAAKVDGEKIMLSPGSVFTVDIGKNLYVTANDEPLALRTWIVTAGGKP